MVSVKYNYPLSPHLSIIKWRFSMLYSILHRATGVALCVGLLLIPVTLYSIYKGEEYYYFLEDILLSPLGLFCIVGWLWSLFYHVLMGIRHLFWEIGFGLNIRAAQISGHLMFLASVVCTLVTLVAIIW